MKDSGVDREKVIKFRGKEFTIIEHLTIGEEIAYKARRNVLCLGQYAQMLSSGDTDEFDAAMLAHAVAEVDARVVKSPDDWDGASNETDSDLIFELFKEIARACGHKFPSDSEGTDKETEGDEGDSSGESVEELEEEVVPGEVQPESEESGVSDDDGQRDTD